MSASAIHRPGKDNATKKEMLKQQVATCLYKNMTQRAIVLELDIPLWKVQRLAAQIRQEWRANRERLAEEHFEEQLAKLNAAEAAIWPSVTEGYAPALERWLQLCDQRNKLEGLYAPTKTEVDIGEQLSQIMTRIAEPAPEIEFKPQIYIEGEVNELQD